MGFGFYRYSPASRCSPLNWVCARYCRASRQRIRRWRIPLPPNCEPQASSTRRGTVDSVVVEWMTVLARRDVALLIHVRSPEMGERPAMALLARFAQWWVVIERSEELIRIGGAGTATAEGAANAVLLAQIERLCGTNVPAPMRPITLDVDALLSGVKSQESSEEVSGKPADGC